MSKRTDATASVRTRQTAPKTTTTVSATIMSGTIAPSFGFTHLADVFNSWVAEWKTRTNKESGDSYNVLIVKFNWKEETTDERPGFNLYRSQDGKLYIQKSKGEFEGKPWSKEKLMGFYRSNSAAVSDQAVNYVKALVAEGVIK